MRTMKNIARAILLVLILGPPVMAGQGWYVMRQDEVTGAWKQLRSFDTAQECEAQKLVGVNILIKTKAKDTDKAFDSFHCIASDDPRLLKMKRGGDEP